MVMYFQVGALFLTVVHGSRAGHSSKDVPLLKYRIITMIK